MSISQDASSSWIYGSELTNNFILNEWNQLDLTVAGVALVSLVGYGLAKWLRFALRVRQSGEPPVVCGHLLWGSAADFAQDAVGTLQTAAKKNGPAFTLRLLNYWVTIVADANSVQELHENRDLSFTPMQKQVNQNVFMFSIKNSDMIIRNGAKTASGEFLKKNTKAFIRLLADAIAAQRIPESGATVHLNEFLDRTLFVAIFESVYGQWPADTGFTPLRFKKNLEILRSYFNYLWLGLPHWIFPKANAAIKELQRQPTPAQILANAERYHVSDYVQFSIKAMLNDGQSDADVAGHNIVHLHVNETTQFLAFWLMYLLVTHPTALCEVQKEVDELVNSCLQKETGTAEISMKELLNGQKGAKLPLLESAITEAARYCSGVFMIRCALRDTEISAGGTKWRVREGDRVAIYPPMLHLDAELFPQPRDFIFDRFASDTTYTQFGQTLSAPPVYPFGTRCPGKQIVLLQVRWLALALLTRFELADADVCERRAEPDPKFYGNEMLPPTFDPRVTLRPRHPQIALQLVD